MLTIEQLRRQVRQHLAPMEETPAPRVKDNGRQLLDQMWDKIERNKPTGRREWVKGREDDQRVVTPSPPPPDREPEQETTRRKLPTLAEEYALQQRQRAQEARQRPEAVKQHRKQGKAAQRHTEAVKRVCVRGAADIKARARRFFEKARAKHGDRYDYSRAVFVNAHTKILIGCPVHGYFEQEPQHHAAGHGCRQCRDEKFLTRGEATRFQPGVIQPTSYNMPRAR